MAYKDVFKSAISTRICSLCCDPAHTGFALCEPCFVDLPRNASCCAICALPLIDDSLSPDPHTKICGRCLRRRPHFDKLTAPFRYEAPCDFMVTQLKFGEKLYFGRLMGSLLATHLRAESVGVDVVSAVPLHPNRLGERGFNQSAAIASVVARKTAVDYNLRLLSRRRNTETQIALPARHRKKNVRNAFSVNQPVAGLKIAVVDDVATTTATTNEVARTLKLAGAKAVYIWTFARAATHGINANQPNQ